MFKELYSERLIIRPIASSDAAFIFELVNSKGWLQFIGDRNVRSVADAQQYIDRILQNPNVQYMVFVRNSSGCALGILTYIEREELPQPDFGFAILPQFEGKGFTREASQVFLHFIGGFRRPELIPAITLAHNAASIRLLEHLGFRPSHTQEVHGDILEVYALKGERLLAYIEGRPQPPAEDLLR